MLQTSSSVPVLGGVLEPEYVGVQMAVQEAIAKVNARRDLLPDVKLSSDMQVTSVDDSYFTSRKGKRTDKSQHIVT